MKSKFNVCSVIEGIREDEDNLLIFVRPDVFVTVPKHVMSLETAYEYNRSGRKLKFRGTINDGVLVAAVVRRTAKDENIFTFKGEIIDITKNEHWSVVKIKTSDDILTVHAPLDFKPVEGPCWGKGYIGSHWIFNIENQVSSGIKEVRPFFQVTIMRPMDLAA